MAERDRRDDYDEATDAHDPAADAATWDGLTEYDEMLEREAREWELDNPFCNNSPYLQNPGAYRGE